MVTKRLSRASMSIALAAAVSCSCSPISVGVASAFAPPQLRPALAPRHSSPSSSGSRNAPFDKSNAIPSRQSRLCDGDTRLYNLLDAMGDMLGGPKLEPETDLPFDPPFCNDLSCSNEVRTFAIKERPISFTGEDFDVVEITNGNEDDFARVRGAMLHLPGKDKMKVSCCATGEKKVEMDRVLIAATPSYDLYRNDGTKIGWIEKKLISFMDSFDVYMEGQGGFGVTGKRLSRQVQNMSSDSQPVRLYQKAVFTGFRRAATNHTPHTALVRIDGVQDRKDTDFYLGKRVAYIYRAHKERDGSKFRCIWGRVTCPHGNSGMVRAKFKKNLPAKAMGATLRVMLYPSNI